MKIKTLKKKIQRLEARLQEGPKKLAKLKQKLVAATAAAAKKKSGARSASKRRASTSTSKKKHHPKAEGQARPATAKKSSAPTKVKRKLNLSPERRAELAAAMKARWAAKRAAVAANSQSTSTTDGDFMLGPNPQGA